MKLLLLTTLFIAATGLAGCQNKVMHIGLQITGQVLDKRTNQPIEGVKTVLSSNAFDLTDAQGRFTVPFVTIKHAVNEPSYQQRQSGLNSSFTIFKSGYEIKSYRNGGLAFTTSPDGQKRYVDMGQVYLMPVPVGKERKYRTHYSTLNFCKPTESQKEFDCIPVPEGKTYEQVSLNQPIK